MFNFNTAVIIPKYGMIIQDDKKLNELDEEQQNRYKFLSYKNRIKIMSSNNKVINKIWVLPAGHLCRGECIYCCNTAFTINSADLSFMTPDIYTKKLKELMPLMNKKIMYISFWGGSTFLSPYMKEFIDITTSLLNETKLVFSFYNDLMLNDKEYNNMINLFDYMSLNKDITIINTLSPDYGLYNSRISTNLNIDNRIIQEKSEYLIERYSEKENIISRVRSLLLENTDINKLMNSFDYYFNKKVYIMFDIVEHNKYSPSIEKCNNIRTIIEDKYNVISSFMDRDYFIENPFLTKNKYNIEDLNNTFYRIDNDTLIFDPSIIACPAFKGQVAFNANKYSPCALMYIETDKLENCLYLDENNKFYELFTDITDECKDCNYLYVCNRCSIRKKSCTCNNIRSMKFRVSWTWDCICKNTDLINIIDLK